MILDTDIGMDVDDVWALVFLLKCPELDIKLITTSTGDTAYRAALVAKILDIAGRTDIPIGVGLALDDSPKTHAEWLADFSLERYEGEVLRDGVGAICETIHVSEDPVKVVAIGPLPNIAAALDRDPDICANAEFVGMHGSIRVGYLGAPKPMREYNVKQYALSCQRVFQAPWRKTITPLDTCGTIILDGDRMQRVLASEDVLTKVATDNHFAWFKAVQDWPITSEMNPNEQSSVLYDTVAVYLAFAEDWLEIEELNITVTADGKTLVDDEHGTTTRYATAWTDKEAFLDFVAERLT